MKLRPFRHSDSIRCIEEQSETADSFLIGGTAREKPVHSEIFPGGPGIFDATILTTTTAMKSGDRAHPGKCPGRTESDILGVSKGGASVRSAA